MRDAPACPLKPANAHRAAVAESDLTVGQGVEDPPSCSIPIRWIFDRKLSPAEIVSQMTDILRLRAAGSCKDLFLSEIPRDESVWWIGENKDELQVG
jgi:hypothetical protein